MRRLRVLTPELVPLEYRLAGMVERGLAWVVDELIVHAVLGLVALLLAFGGVLTFGVGFTLIVPVYLLASFVLDFGYRWSFEARFRGRTLGKRLLGLRAVQENGAALHSWQAMVRNVARVVDALPFLYLLGALSMLLDGNSRRIGDRLAGTVVIREMRHEPPRGARVLAAADNSIATDVAAVSRIRKRLTAREGALLTEFVVAAERMETARRLELARRLAGFYRDRLRLEAHAGLPDEMVLRGIAGVVARDRFGTPARAR